MSFDIFFQTGRFSGKSVVQKNPFTGEEQVVLPAEPLNAAELKAARQVLKRVGAQGPDEHGCYVVDLEDGGEAEVFADQLETGCMVSVRGITPDLIQFLFDLLEAGNWVMLPAMEDTVAISTSRGSVNDAPDNLPKLVACDSADELGVLLTKGVKAWQAYRDQVTGGRNPRKGRGSSR